MGIRNIIQIAATPAAVDFHPLICALCDDGTLWVAPLSNSGEKTIWSQIITPDQPSVDKLEEFKK